MVCIDGSQSSLKATKNAFNFAKKFNATVTVIYVSFIPPYLKNAPELGWNELYKSEEEMVNSWLKNILDESFDYEIDFKVEVKQTTISIADEIVKSAKENNVDLIVVGSTTKSKLGRLFIGSVAQGVMNNSKCSVLVVR